MSKVSKFYNFVTEKNKQKLYVYGEIIGGSEKWDESEVVFDDFKDTVEAMPNDSVLDIYVNSPGGSVFATQGIVALLRRAKDRGVTINAYLDGIAASSASWLPMIANTIYAYPQSIMMIHSPYTFVAGNAKEMEKEIAVLNKIQNDVIIPLYMEKAKEGITAERIQELMEAETWFNASEMAEIFNIELLEEKKEMKMCATKEILNKYRNTPVELLNQADDEEPEAEPQEPQEPVEPQGEGEEPEQEPENPDTAEVEGEGEEPEAEPTLEPETHEDEAVKELENNLQAAMEENKRLTNELHEANKKILDLNEKIGELQPIVDQYNSELAAKEAEEKAAILNEKKAYYKNKFEKLGAKNKFETKEVQDLVNCVLDEKAEFELSKMLVNLMEDTTEKSTVVGTFNKYKTDDNMDNLIPDIEDVGSKYGFK